MSVLLPRLDGPDLSGLDESCGLGSERICCPRTVALILPVIMLVFWKIPFLTLSSGTSALGVSMMSSSRGEAIRLDDHWDSKSFMPLRGVVGWFEFSLVEISC